MRYIGQSTLPINPSVDRTLNIVDVHDQSISIRPSKRRVSYIGRNNQFQPYVYSRFRPKWVPYDTVNRNIYVYPVFNLSTTDKGAQKHKVSCDSEGNLFEKL